jgi:hypothetical protein
LDQEIATNPVAGADAPAPGVAADAPQAAVRAGDGAPDAMSDAAAEADAGEPAAADESEEIEHEGRTYRVPKALKGAFLMQADYTRKTQELAEQRRALDSQHALVEQEARWNREHAAEIGSLVAMDARLQHYGRVDWQAWTQQDPAAAQAAFIDYQQLRDARAATAQSLAQRDAGRRAAQEQQLEARLADGHARLAREIPGWGAELQGRLVEFGVTNGLTRDELENVADPRLVRILHKAYLGEQILNQQRAAARQATQPPPAQPVTTIAARKAPVPVSASSPASDRLSADEWMRRRNAEVARQGRR